MQETCLVNTTLDTMSSELNPQASLGNMQNPVKTKFGTLFGGLTAGIVFLGQGRPTLLNRETPGSPDYNLHLKAFELADNLDVNQASTWVLKNLATWPVKLMHGILKPGGR